MASEKFINELKNGAYANRLGKMTIDNIAIDETQYLNQITIKESIYNNDSILGGLFDKTLNVTLVNKPSNLELESKAVSDVGIGVRYDDNTTEYEEFDDFVIEEIKDSETDSTTQFTAYGSGAKLDEPYNCTLDFENSTHTVYEFYQDVCNQLGLTPSDSSFINDNIVAVGNPFTNNESCRVVLNAIEKLSCNFIDINWKNKTIDLKWFSDQIDYVFEPSDYSTLEGKLIKYGPVNIVTIGNSQVTGENVSEQDDESIELNGENEIMIDEPYFLYNQALREQALPNIYNKIIGFEYYDVKLETPYGKPFLKVGNRISINTIDGNTYTTYVLTHELTFNGTIKSVISSSALTKTEQTTRNNINSNSIQNRLRQTEIIVDKQNGIISEVVSKTEQLEESIEILSVDLDSNIIVVSTDGSNKPFETKSYTVNFTNKYLGTPIYIVPTTENSYIGISVSTTNSAITFTVDNNTSIQGSDNKYTFTWSYTDVEGNTNSISKAITLTTIQSESEQNIIMSETAPSDTSVLWFNTTNNLIYIYDENEEGTYEWLPTNDYQNQIESIQQTLSGEDGINSQINELAGKVAINETNIKNKLDTSAFNSFKTSYESEIGNYYKKDEIKQIVNGTGVDGVTVSAVISTTGTFDADGMHYQKSTADTVSTINHEGVSVDDKNNKELFFAGVREGTSTSVVESNTLNVKDELTVGNNRGMLKEFTDTIDNITGVGFFLK